MSEPKGAAAPELRAVLGLRSEEPATSEEGMRRLEAPRRRAGEPGPRRGRPPRIDRDAIARVAGEIPLSDLSLRTVADRLGVSVPGLYHYVQGRDELFALAAEQSVRRLPLPVDRDQHWAIWLYEWAGYILSAFVSDPG